MTVFWAVVVCVTILLLPVSNGQIKKKLAPQPTLNVPDDLLRCCNIIENIQNLSLCVEQLTNTTNERIWQEMYSAGGPSLSVAIVSYATDNIKNYTAYAYAVNAAYAQHNNYILKLLGPSSSDYEPADSRWNKVKILSEAIHPEHGWARASDYVMWVDADMIFLDMGLRVEKVAADHPKAHVLASAEHAGSTTLINSGSVLVRNSEFARSFLTRWWEHADRSLLSDQEQFDLLYREMSSGRGGGDDGDGVGADAQEQQQQELRERVVILPPDALNSDPPAMTQQTEHNQVLHLMGEQTAFRTHVFRSAFQEICRHVRTVKYQQQAHSDGNDLSAASRLAPQLTATQRNLLQWTLDIYADESGSLLDAYTPGAAKGVHGLSASRDLSNSVHHYAHALEHSQQLLTQQQQQHQHQQQQQQQQQGSKSIGDADAQAIWQQNLALAARLRRRVYSLLLTNLDAQRALHINRAKALHGASRYRDFYPYPSDWPEHVKTVATAGQHLLSTGTVSERLALLNQLTALVDEMTATSNPAQHSAVQHMAAHLLMQRGLLYLHPDIYDIQQAHAHLARSLAVSESLATASGEHILVSPLTVCANVLATMQRYQEAFTMYVRAARLSELHLGRDHESIGTLLVNYGIALVQSAGSSGGSVGGGGDCAAHYTTAVDVLQRALRVMESGDVNGMRRGSVSYTRGMEFLRQAREGASRTRSKAGASGDGDSNSKRKTKRKT